MCYCKNGKGALAKSVEDAEAKVGQITADVEAGEAEAKQLKADLKSHQTDRAAAKAAIAEAKGIRAKEAQDFAALSAEANANIAAATKATAAVSKGMSGRRVFFKTVPHHCVWLGCSLCKGVFSDQGGLRRP